MPDKKKRDQDREQQRIKEYVDSPLMTQRIRNDQELSARIDGNSGVYQTQARIGRPAEGWCTCPSDWRPCKHVKALLQTWEANPKSFFDLATLQNALAAMPKDDLLAAIVQMAWISPASLSALGIEGFGDDDGDEDEEDEEDWS